MRSVTQQNFGLIIAYLVPGSTALAGVACFSTTVQRWLGASQATAPTISGFMFATLASVGLGVTANTLRRLVIDRLHHATGIRKREWKYAVLQRNLDAVEFVVENQFRFHQFHGNMLVALIFAYIAFEISVPGLSLWRLAAFSLTEIVFLMGSRESLRLYYQRLADLLGVDGLESENPIPSEPDSQDSSGQTA